MDFKRTSIIKHPVEAVWVAMRDKMPEVVELLKEVESVTISSYEERESGDVVVTKVWKAAPTLPAVVAKHIEPDMLAWTEYGEWKQDMNVCNWRIETHFFKEAIDCRGETEFMSALGGKGTRINFIGSIGIDADGLSDKLSIARAISTQVLELVAQRIIPRNFAESANAVAKYLDMSPDNQ